MTATLLSLSVKLYKQYRAKTVALQNLQTHLPDVSGTSVSGTPFTLRALPVKHSTMIVLFNPFCEHCDYEADQIKQYAPALADIRVVMVSDEKAANIKAFQMRHALAATKDVDCIHMDTNQIFATFGSLNVPQTYLYDAHGRLRHVFKGEAGMDQILLAL